MVFVQYGMCALYYSLKSNYLKGIMLSDTMECAR